MDKNYDYLFKFMLIGESGVGKTCFFLRYTDDSFTSNLLVTIGIDFKVKILQIGNKRFKLQIWDTAGLERFHKIVKSYYKGAHGIIIIYDVTNRYSFENVSKTWIRMIKENSPNEIPTFLVGNKIDKPDRVVTTEEGENLAKELGIPFFECSSKTGYNIDNIFRKLVKKVHENLGIYLISILGDKSVGKSCIFKSYIGKELIIEPKSFEFITKTIKGDDNRIITLEIFEVSDNQKNHISLKEYYKDLSGLLLVYDVTNKNSFDNLNNWIKEIESETFEKIPIFIVGNKIDDTEHRIITTEQGKQFVEKYQLEFCECSAKYGTNIDFIFKKLTKKLLQNKTENIINDSFKISILGDRNIGKSSLFNYYQNGIFVESYYSGTNEIFTKNVRIDKNNLIKINIYDMSVNEQYRPLLKEYYKDSNGIILIYDVTNKNSFDNLKNWIKEISIECEKDTHIFIVGNKIDDTKHRIITTEQGKKLAEDYNLMFCECSAKSGTNINFIFNQLVQNIFDSSEYHNQKKLKRCLLF